MRTAQSAPAWFTNTYCAPTACDMTAFDENDVDRDDRRSNDILADAGKPPTLFIPRVSLGYGTTLVSPA